jgi:hypothetical protein
VHVLGLETIVSIYTEAMFWRVSTVTLLVVMVISGAVPVLSTRESFQAVVDLGQASSKEYVDEEKHL